MLLEGAPQAPNTALTINELENKMAYHRVLLKSLLKTCALQWKVAYLLAYLLAYHCPLVLLVR